MLGVRTALSRFQAENMKRLVIVLLFAASASAQSGPGMYFESGDAHTKMEHTALAGIESKGAAKSLFVPGSGVSAVWEYAGAHASVHTGVNPKFVYELRESQVIRQWVLVRMDEKSDRREIRVAKVSGWTGDLRAGFDVKKLVELRVTKREGKIEIAPLQTLSPGEYYITAGFSSVGYDFTVTN
jgi:hypothetical protein